MLFTPRALDVKNSSTASLAFFAKRSASLRGLGQQHHLAVGGLRSFEDLSGIGAGPRIDDVGAVTNRLRQIAAQDMMLGPRSASPSGDSVRRQAFVTNRTA